MWLIAAPADRIFLTMVQAFTMGSAVVPSLLLLWYFHSRDTFPEPGRIVWRTFALGALAIIPVCIVALPVAFVVAKTAGNPVLLGFLKAFVTAAIPEEAFKFAILAWYVRRQSAFDEPMDGLVYGTAASLGFATLENILYCAQGGPVLAVLRAVSAVPVHAGCGAIMGYFFGRAHFEPARRGPLLARAYLIPMLLHGLYDWPILTLAALPGSAGKPPTALGVVLFLIALVLVGVIVTGTLRIVRRARREQKERGIPQDELTMRVPVPETAKKTADAGSIAGGAVLVLLGGLFASAGGLILLALILMTVRGPRPDGGPVVVAIAVALFGVLPLLLGLVLFRGGIRVLNRPRGT